jgi:hypothetical protein
MPLTPKLFAIALLLLAAASPSPAKDSTPILPPWLLQARTVAVLVDPDAGIDLQDPNANQNAQRDVEAALQKWGRFEVVLTAPQADLVVVIRKGHGKLVTETASDPRQNNRPGSVTNTDGGISVGAQHGTPPATDPRNSMPGSGLGGELGTSSPSPKMEVGAVNDSFVVYEGKTPAPTDGAPAWRWDHKNGLHSHDVPAVDEFRKAIAAAEQAAQQNKKHP